MHNIFGNYGKFERIKETPVYEDWGIHKPIGRFIRDISDLSMQNYYLMFDKQEGPIYIFKLRGPNPVMSHKNSSVQGIEPGWTAMYNKASLDGSYLLGAFFILDELLNVTFDHERSDLKGNPGQIILLNNEEAKQYTSKFSEKTLKWFDNIH